MHPIGRLGSGMKVSQQEIIAAARELFRTQGYAGASMQDLANRVGLKKASLYSRFPDKEALVREVLQLTLDETFAAAGDADDWRTAYETALRSMSEALMDRGRCVGFHLAYGASADTPRALEAVRGFFNTCRRRLAEMLAAVADPGEADRIAVDALSQIEGATLWLAVDGNRTAMQRTLDRLLAEADGLQARHHGRARTNTRARS
jgi:TetR/AcrR family transcriptional repressor of nem operon